jgi:pilus assembly protein CpaB
MKRRVIGIVLALVLAAAGTAALVAYVQSSTDDEAEPQVSVLVVSESIRQGADLGEIEDRVALTEVPERLVAADALSDLAGLAPDLVAAVELQPGEQLLRSRLVEARTLVRADVPEGLQELTIALDPERAVGGELQAGDTVGVVLSFDPFDISAASQPGQPGETVPGGEPATAGARTPNTTHLTLHKVLVTGVQYSQQDSERASEIQSGDSEDSEDTDATLAPTVAEAPGDQLLVTLAVRAPEVEQIVFAAEFGYIWLTSEGLDADEDGTRILTLDQVYATVPR